MLLRKKEEIEAWLNKYDIYNYDLIEHKDCGYIVNVHNDVKLFHKGIKRIDVKFNIIYGNFYCGNNELESLEGCPKRVCGNFSCNYNKLKTLEGCPEIVEGDFYCSYNQLTSLKNFPKIIKDNIYISHNKLTSLKGCPDIINGNFHFEFNKLTVDSLKHLPKEVKGNIRTFTNKKLGDLQNITNLNELKIILEKKNLLNIISKNEELKTIKIVNKL